MKRGARLLVQLSTLSAVAILVGDGPAAQAQAPAIQRKTVLQPQDSTIPGYQVLVNIVEIPAGVSEVRHTHPGPLVGYILEGSVILEHEGRPDATYNAGDAFLVEANKIHRGTNAGSVPVRILATLTFEKGKATSSPAP